MHLCPVVQGDASDIYSEFDNYIASKARKVTRATLTVYNNVKLHLQAFEVFRKEIINFDSVDFTFYDDFVDYLTFEHVYHRRNTEVIGLRLNTIGKTIKHLRGFIRDRARGKRIQPIDLSDYKVREEEADSIYLSHEEIVKLYQTEFSEHPHLVEYRDLFVLACLTGLRFSDFSSLKPEDLQKGMLHKSRRSQIIGSSFLYVKKPNRSLQHTSKIVFQTSIIRNSIGTSNHSENLQGLTIV